MTRKQAPLNSIETTGDTPIFDPSEVQVFRTVESLLEGCEFDLGVITFELLVPL